MIKNKSVNPAQAQRKAEKAKAIKKSKAEAAARRNEKLARRNPDRLQKQLDDLKAIENKGIGLTNHEKNVLEGLEKEIRAVRKARESLGNTLPKNDVGVRKGYENKPSQDRKDGTSSMLGKRQRREELESSEESDVPEEVKRIPMPRDTPPPIPKEILDKWYQKRRDRMAPNNRINDMNANLTPLGNNDHCTTTSIDKNSEETLLAKPIVESQTVYEAKPVIRDLRKEATVFVPTVVRVKIDKMKGVGSLIEPEEADKLETDGYLPKKNHIQINKELGDTINNT
ncbi:putative ww domain binding protein 11 protein [Erysiphe necator]|uniref:Putative ww domain binding protein 11 protein n=1 Tax=Uncinula necator TaxID=52586 RepID=A0A0B1PET0_UNCNE|nr:putative ww domain binding protein 11 protein [Erysiphe necator]